MDYLSVIAAGVAAWIFGMAWYMVFANQWMDASKLNKKSVNRSNPVPWVASLIGSILVAGMMSHMMDKTNIVGIEESLLTGLGLGLFMVSPWIVSNILFGQRSRRLIWIDCGYPIIGMGIMGVVLDSLDSFWLF